MGIWKHKTKWKGKEFKGQYEWSWNADNGNKEREFHLIGNGRRITMESWQMAKKLDWVKIK